MSEPLGWVVLGQHKEPSGEAGNGRRSIDDLFIADPNIYRTRDEVEGAIADMLADEEHGYDDYVLTPEPVGGGSETDAAALRRILHIPPMGERDVLNALTLGASRIEERPAHPLYPAHTMMARTLRHLSDRIRRALAPECVASEPGDTRRGTDE